jgi:hypothetical protein
MKKIVRLTESDITRIVKRVMNESPLLLGDPDYESNHRDSDEDDDNLSDDGFRWYSLKIGENLPVKKLKIQLDALERPASIEIEMSQTNFLFDTRKKMHMNFVDGKVQTYSIEGTQQMRWASPTHYQLLGVLLPK